MLVVLAVEVDAVAEPQLAHQPDRLAQPGVALLELRPLALVAGGDLVERLAGADAEEDPVRVQAAHGRERLRDDGGVVAERRGQHRRAQDQPLGALAHRGHPGQRERRMPALVAPRLEVVADRRTVHAVLFGRDGQLDEFARGELLRRRLVSEFQFRFEFSHVFVSTPPAYTREMAPALSAITDTVHFAQTDLVNWTLVTDGNGVMLIDAGFPGSRDDVLASLRAARVRRRRPARDPVDPRPHRPFRFGDLVRENPWHTGVLPCRRGRPRQAGVPRAGVAGGRRHARLAAALAEVVGGDQPQGGVHARRHPDRAGADRRRRSGAARRADGDSHARAHRRALLVRGRRCAGQRRRAGDRAPGVDAQRPAAAAGLFNHDQDGCVRSLAALAMLDTEVLLPGHGPVWRGPIRNATEKARAQASS